MQLSRVLRMLGAPAVAVATLFAGLVASAPSAAAADCGKATCATTGGGYTVTATVHFSGDAAPGGGGTVSMGVPASCWWSIWDAVPADPASWVAFYDNYVKGLSGYGGEVASAYFTVPLHDAWVAAAARAIAGEPLRVYSVHCVSDDVCKAAAFAGGAAQYGYPGMKCTLPLMTNFFPTGNPPQPQVDPEDLAKIARDHMNIPVPEIDRNPKVGSLGQATLVTLPTWFWVTNPAAVGGADGTRTIRADVGPVWAQVVARTNGLTITSPAGGASCPPEAATRAYSAGAADASGCTVAFERASTAYAGGYPVDASTAWNATWTGVNGAGAGVGGTLPGLARNTTVAVPVAESQALVGRS